MSDYKLSTLWIEAFAIKGDGLDEKRAYLVAAYEKLRERVAVLVEDIRPDMRGLTVHDITHIDALWEIASTIAGSSYPINAAEAFVLGGAFLLHDAAHCVAAYPDGITGLNATAEWKQVCTRHKLDPLNMAADSPEYKKVIFDVLRLLHPKRARDLLGAKWRGQYLLEDSDLREDFKEVVGAVAESHWFNTSQLEQFNKETLTCPASLAPANWRIDKLKIAILLRTADAAHIDSRRAPTFLRAIMNPNGVSGLHWEFQNNMWQVGLKEDSDELYVSSRPFSLEQRAAWWLAYDTAQMIDKELIDADRLLKEFRSESDRLKATNFKSARSPDLFCVTVPTKGWQPVDTSIKVTNIKKLVQTFGGEKLYGPEPKWALRELLQNSVDAVHALRAIGGLGKEEGEIEVSLETVGDHYWLHITDNGVGMGKFVLSEVLVDFGRSLWKDGALSREWETLVGTDFKSIGQFGIGFFSAFMLGDRIRVISRRYERVEGEPQSWVMEFDDGLESRSLLRSARPDESLLRAGTKVSIFLTSQKLKKLCSLKGYDKNLSEILLYLAPALDINLRYKDQNCSARQLIAANDWKSMPAHDLTERIKFHSIERENLYSELKNDEGDIIGRVGISTHRVLSYGVGVVGGIFAGPLDYLEGLVICGDQNDVARKSAVPIANFSNFIDWAKTQKSLLLAANKLTLNLSGALNVFGCAIDDMIVVEDLQHGNPIYYADFVQMLANLQGEIKICVDSVDWNEDDEVSSAAYDSFAADENVFIGVKSYEYGWLENINKEAAEYGKELQINFYEKMLDGLPDLKLARRIVMATIGYVGEVSIERACLVVTRAQPAQINE